VALLAIGVIGIAGRTRGRPALRPLHRVTQTAQRSARRRSPAHPLLGPDDEVAELARTFDAMLDRLAGAFESQKRSWPTRRTSCGTPLAVMRTEST